MLPIKLPVEVIILPTVQCHRGCAFCGMDSTCKGIHMRKTWIPMVIEQIVELGDVCKSVFVSGLGEPLEYPWLLELMQGLLQTQAGNISFMTSGCKNQKEIGYDNLVALSQLRDPRVNPTISISNVHPWVSIQRMRFSVPFLEQISTQINVKLIDGKYPRKPTRLAIAALLYWSLCKLGYSEYLPKEEMAKLPEEHQKRLKSEMQRQGLLLKNARIEADEDGFAIYPSHLMTYMVRSMIRVGRAIDYLDLPREGGTFGKNPICSVFDGSCEHRLLYIHADGRIFPCDCVGWDDKMSLGHISDISLKEALELREPLLEKAFGNYIASPAILPDRFRCTRCCTQWPEKQYNI